MSERLTDKELQDYFELIGRPVDERIVSLQHARAHLASDRNERMKLRQYSRRVWTGRDVSEFIADQAMACAEFAASLRNASVRVETFNLRNVNGLPSAFLGGIRLRLGYYDKRLQEELGVGDQRTVIAVESINLHPSLRRKGFLKALAKNLSGRDLTCAVFCNVMNPAFAYYLYNRSLEGSGFCVLSSEETVDFENRVSPVPTIAMLLR